MDNMILTAFLVGIVGGLLSGGFWILVYMWKENKRGKK